MSWELQLPDPPYESVNFPLALKVTVSCAWALDLVSFCLNVGPAPFLVTMRRNQQRVQFKPAEARYSIRIENIEPQAARSLPAPGSAAAGSP